jgi:hypothetical protein
MIQRETTVSKDKLAVLYSFFWVIPRGLNFICRRFGTLCSTIISGISTAREDGTECSETSAYKI